MLDSSARSCSTVRRELGGRLQRSDGQQLGRCNLSTQVPRLKCGWLRPGLGHAGERHGLLDGEGRGLSPPIRRPSLPNCRIALRGPAPPHPWGFLPQIKSGVGGHPNPFAGEDRLSWELPSICLSEPPPCPIAGFGFLELELEGGRPRGARKADGRVSVWRPGDSLRTESAGEGALAGYSSRLNSWKSKKYPVRVSTSTSSWTMAVWPSSISRNRENMVRPSGLTSVSTRCL